MEDYDIFKKQKKGEIMENYFLDDLNKCKAYTIRDYVLTALEFCNIELKEGNAVRVRSIIVCNPDNPSAIYIPCDLWNYDRLQWEDACITDYFYREVNPEYFDELIEEIMGIEEIKKFADFIEE